LKTLGLTRNLDELEDIANASALIDDVRKQEDAVRALAACMKRG